MNQTGLISKARTGFQAAVASQLLRLTGGVPSNADSNNRNSVTVATGIATRIGKVSTGERLAAQVSGTKFEEICESYLSETFLRLRHLRPGTWSITRSSVPGKRGISRFAQYRHLTDLERISRQNSALAAAIGSDYIIKPDVMIFREPEPDEIINSPINVVDPASANLTGLRDLELSTRQTPCSTRVFLANGQSVVIGLRTPGPRGLI